MCSFDHSAEAKDITKIQLDKGMVHQQMVQVSPGSMDSCLCTPSDAIAKLLWA